jgi:hypothetical protein
MRWHEIVGESVLTELFDSTGGAEWSVKSNTEWRADFVVDDIPFEFYVEINSRTKMWEIEFAVDNRHDKVKRGGAFGSTGASGTASVKVFGIVVGLVREWLNVMEPEVFTFSGDKGDGKAKLYSAMVKRMEPELRSYGYTNRVESKDATQSHGAMNVFTFHRIQEAYEDFHEHASAGATGSGNVATSVAAVGGLGAGFDPDGDWGIYQSSKGRKKPTVIRR